MKLISILSVAVVHCLFVLGISFIADIPEAYAKKNTFICPKVKPKIPKMARKEVYQNVPFKAGEKATYELSWMGMKAGYGTLEVRKARKYKGIWHRIFHVDASTGDWFKAIFVAKEKMEAISRPWDFGISKFYLQQREGKFFASPFIQKKWLEFEHDKCRVIEIIKSPGKKELLQTFDFSYGAVDALGVIFQLRTRDYKIGKVERALVYSSEQNWWLDAKPVAFEKVKVPAGTFDTIKLKLDTYLGKELQQKGDVFAWVSTKTPEKQLVQLQGEIKIGSVWLKLHRFKPGK